MSVLPPVSGLVSGEEENLLRAVEEAGKVEDNLIRLSTGVVLRGKKINPLTLIAVMARYPHPSPPTHFIKEMGRVMENTDDPDYIERVKNWDILYKNSLLNAMTMLGTELVSFPKGFYGPQDPKWLQKFEALGLPTRPDNQGWMYLMWVMHEAVVDEKDVKLIQEVVGRLSGVKEADVKAAETFPGSDQKG